MDVDVAVVEDMNPPALQVEHEGVRGHVANLGETRCILDPIISH